MIPFKDNLLYIGRPTVTSLLIIINCLFFIIEKALQESGRHYAALVQQYGMFTSAHVTHAYASADAPAMLFVTITIFTSMFLHGGLMHIFGNMVFLSCFGRAVEARLGKKQYVAFYLFAGFAATAGQYFMNPLSETPGLGASGAIAGVLSAYMIFFPKARIVGFSSQSGIASAPAWSFLLVWIGMQLISVVSRHPGEIGGVAYGAHIGGFMFGLAAGLLASWFKPVQTVMYIDAKGQPQKPDTARSITLRFWLRVKVCATSLRNSRIVSWFARRAVCVVLLRFGACVCSWLKQLTLRIRQRKSLPGSQANA